MRHAGSHDGGYDAQHCCLWFADAETTNGVAVKADREQFTEALGPEVWEDATLYNSEKGGWTCHVDVRLLGSECPSEASVHSICRLLLRGRILEALIEHHVNVTAEFVLNLDGCFGIEVAFSSVHSRTERDASFCDDTVLEAEDLFVSRGLFLGGGKDGEGGWFGEEDVGRTMWM